MDFGSSTPDMFGLVSQPSSDELMAEEERLWTELHLLVDSLPEDKVEEPESAVPAFLCESWPQLRPHLASAMGRSRPAGTRRGSEV